MRGAGCGFGGGCAEERFSFPAAKEGCGEGGLTPACKGGCAATSAEQDPIWRPPLSPALRLQPPRTLRPRCTALLLHLHLMMANGPELRKARRGGNPARKSPKNTSKILI